MKQLNPRQRHLKERAVVVGIELPYDDHGVSVEHSLEELERLAETAGARVVRRFTQRIRSISPATLIGRGKIDEIQISLNDLRPDLLIIDADLTPAQQRNLEGALQVRVVDRNQLILDIFAQRAQSNEGKLQVELAQLDYLLPRLTRQWTHLSRLGGGIGTRGPGETQLEVDRRRIRERIGHLKRRLKTVERTRRLHREERESVPFATVALVGYTNAGKSTLMNTLTRAGVFVEDKLFATLDPTTRALRLPNGDKVMLVDTVGFINKLPHSLIEAFKSTLEEVKKADLLLHLVDMTSPLFAEHIEVVEEVLTEIGAGGVSCILVPNKIDIVSSTPAQALKKAGVEGVCSISARTGSGVDRLLQLIGDVLARGKERLQLSLTAQQGGLLALLREHGQIIEEHYEGDQIRVTALVSGKLAGQLRKKLGANGARPPAPELSLPRE